MFSPKKIVFIQKFHQKIIFLPKTCFQKKNQQKTMVKIGPKKINKDQKDSVGDEIDLWPLKFK